MKNSITFDVMVGDTFYRTLRMPITIDMVVDYIGDEPMVDSDIVEKCAREYALMKCPTLKYDKFRVCF